LGVEDGEIELDNCQCIAVGDGKSVPCGIEGHRRRLRAPFETPHDAAILETRVQFGPHMEHVPSRKFDQFRMPIEGKYVVGADRQGRAGRLIELEGAKARVASEIVDG
jgi:hypothetical protein